MEFLTDLLSAFVYGLNSLRTTIKVLKSETSTIITIIILKMEELVLQCSVWMANSIGQYQKQSDQGLHCSLSTVCPDT